MSAGHTISPKLVLPLALSGVAALVTVLWAAGGPLELLHWIERAGVTGLLAYVFVYVLGTVLFLPPGILNIAAGLIFGPVVGAVLALLANVLSAIVAFLVSRHVARSWVARLVARRRRLLAVDRAVEKGGLKVVLLLRMSPVSPFSILNYAFGMSRVRARDYVLGSMLGTVPGTVLYVYIGSLLTSMVQIFSTGAAATSKTIFLWVGLIATVAAFSIVARLAKAELKRLAAE